MAPQGPPQAPPMPPQAPPQPIPIPPQAPPPPPAGSYSPGQYGQVNLLHLPAHAAYRAIPTGFSDTAWGQGCGSSSRAVHAKGCDPGNSRWQASSHRALCGLVGQPALI